jgi:hypothetical protein
MASLVDLYARPGEGAILTLWRIGITNADSVVTLTIDPTLDGAAAVADTAASGDDQGRVGIEIPTDAAAGTYTWSAEIDSVVVWTGHIYIQTHPRSASWLAHSPDIRSETQPPVILWRAEDTTAPEESGVPDGGTDGQVLTKQSADDGDADWETPAAGAGLPAGGTTGQALVKASGDDFDAEWADVTGTGDVTAAVAFGADNRLLRSDGTGKGAQASGVTLSDGDALSGLKGVSTTDFAATGTITGITAAAVGADPTGTASSAVATHTALTNPHGTAFLDLDDAPSDYTGQAAKAVVVNATEDALEFATLSSGAVTFTDLTDAPSDYIGHGGKVVKVTVAEDGLEFVAGGAGVDAFTDLSDVPSAYTGAGGKVLAVTTGEDGVEFVTLTAADVGADPSGTAATAVAALTLETLVPGTATASQVPRRNSGDTAFEWATLTAADVGADATGTAAAAVAALTLDTFVPGTAAALQVPRRNSGDTAFEWRTLTASDVGADATGTAASAVATHAANATLHLPSSLGSANQELRMNSGATAPEWFTPTLDDYVPGTATALQVPRRNAGDTAFEWASVGTEQQHFVGNAVPGSGLGNNGDTYERLTTGEYFVKSGGSWARSQLFTAMAGMSGYTFEVLPRNNSGTLTNNGGQASSTAFGSTTGVTYATSNARTSHIRVAFNGAATANTVCSGVITPQQGIVHVGSSSRHGRFKLKFRFGLASVVAANFRFFAGVITTAGTFSDDPTGASSVLGDRIGLAVDANTALAAKWIVNYSGANQNNTAAYTLVQDNWYEIVMYTTPFSNVIHMELWEQTTANGSLGSAPVSSIDFAVTSDIVDIALRPYLAAANAATAAASCNVHFGGLMGCCFYPV